MTGRFLHNAAPAVRAAKWLSIASLGLLLGACASTPPAGLEDPLTDAPAQRAAWQNPEAFLNQRVRWGGEILSVVNNAADTEIEVYGRPLSNDAEPKPDGGDGVRFIAVVDGFLDPALYSPGKRVTVSGVLIEPRSRLVGEFSYRYPVVNVQNHHLWPAYQAPVEPLGWRYPYYDPWWPSRSFRRWPYYW